MLVTHFVKEIDGFQFKKQHDFVKVSFDCDAKVGFETKTLPITNNKDFSDDALTSTELSNDLNLKNSSLIASLILDLKNCM
jgi:hypothetical protein